MLKGSLLWLENSDIMLFGEISLKVMNDSILKNVFLNYTQFDINK